MDGLDGLGWFGENWFRSLGGAGSGRFWIVNTHDCLLLFIPFSIAIDVNVLRVHLALFVPIVPRSRIVIESRD